MASTTFAESKPARLVVEIRPPVARIVLRHAPLNVIDIAMMEELAGALAEAEARSDISVVVLVGEGKDFSAGVEAAAIGLANRSVTDKELAEVVDHTLQELLTLSPAALGVTKKAVYGWDSMHFDKGLARAEKIYLEELMKTADAREGISAFLEKRKPNWTGK